MKCLIQATNFLENGLTFEPNQALLDESSELSLPDFRGDNNGFIRSGLENSSEKENGLDSKASPSPLIKDETLTS